MSDARIVYILLPVRDGRRYLAAQLDSILSQSYRNWRLLAVDDGSGDESFSILQDYARRDGRISAIRREASLGLIEAIRALILSLPPEARYAAFSDHDDVWLPGKLEALVSAMAAADKPGQPVLVHSDSTIVDEKLRPLKRRFVARYAKVGNLFGALRYCSVQGASCLANRALLELMARMPPDTLWYDRYMHLAAEFLGERRFVDRSLMLYRQHGSNFLGSSGASYRVLCFRYPAEEPWIEANAQAIEDWSASADARRRGQLRAWSRYRDAATPVLARLGIAARFLWAHPSVLAKEATRIVYEGRHGRA